MLLMMKFVQKVLALRKNSMLLLIRKFIERDIYANGPQYKTRY